MTDVVQLSRWPRGVALLHSKWGEASSRLERRGGLSLSFKIGAGMLAAYFAIAVVALAWTPFDPEVPGVGPSFASPGAVHWFGTDRLGRDVFSQTLAAAPIDLGIVLVAVLSSFVVGTFLGTIAGYFRGAADVVVTRSVEILQAFPALLLALLVVQAMGAGIGNVIVVLAIVGLPNYIRLARAEIMTKRSWQYAEAARLAGANSWRVAFQHLLPNSIGPLIAFTSINASWSVLIAASLGFLGVGLPPGTPEWGALISQGQDAIMSGDWWISLFPGIAIVGLAAAFYLVGDGLSDLLDPKRRS